MAKSLKQILELYVPKSKDEKRFMDKHVVKKNKLDDPSKDDDVFQANNVKKSSSANYGYKENQDEAVYEENKMTDAEMAKREKIVKFMKGKMANESKQDDEGSEEEKAEEYKEPEEVSLDHAKRQIKNGTWKQSGPVRPGKLITVETKNGKQKTVLVTSEQLDLMSHIFKLLDEENQENFFDLLENNFDDLMNFIGQFELAE